MFELESLRFKDYLTFADRCRKRYSDKGSDVTLGLGRFSTEVFMTEFRILNCAACDLMMFALENWRKLVIHTSAILFFSWHQLFGEKKILSQEAGAYRHVP